MKFDILIKLTGTFVCFREPVTPELVEVVKRAEGVDFVYNQGRYDLGYYKGRAFDEVEVALNISAALAEVGDE